MILGSLTAKMFGFKGKAKIVTEIVVGAVEVGVVLVLGLAAYPAEAIALNAATMTAKSVWGKKLKRLAKKVLNK